MTNSANNELRNSDVWIVKLIRFNDPAFEHCQYGHWLPPPSSVVCLCKWTQLMVILLKALCITYEVFFNFKAFHVCGLSNVPWISCAKYLLFDDKREIYVSNSCIHFDYDHFRLENKLQPVSKNHFFLCTYIVKIQRSHVSGCLVTVLRMSWPGHVSRVTCHMLSSGTCEVLAGREVAADWGISPPASHHRHQRVIVRSSLVLWNDPSVSQSVFTITEKAPTRAFSWLKAPNSAFTFETLLRHEDPS